MNFLLQHTIQNCNVITFTPEAIFLTNNYNVKAFYYYISDDYTSLPWWNNFLKKRQFKNLEKKLLNVTKKVLVTSNTLFNKYRNKNKNVSLFQIPANTKVYLRFNINESKTPKELRNIPHPITGFIGSWYDWKIDIDLVKKLLFKYKNNSFVFIGVIQTKYDDIITLPNFYRIKCKSIKQLPSYVSLFDVCLIPYRKSKYGQSAYPVKVMEYLALGKPVVTTALPSIKHLADKGLIYWAKNDEEFIKYIEIALHEKKDPELIKRRIEEAKKNDWNLRIKDFVSYLND